MAKTQFESGLLEEARRWPLALLLSLPPLFSSIVPSIFEAFDWIDQDLLFLWLLLTYAVAPAAYVLLRFVIKSRSKAIAVALVLLLSCYLAVFLGSRSLPWGLGGLGLMGITWGALAFAFSTPKYRPDRVELTGRDLLRLAPLVLAIVLIPSALTLLGQEATTVFESGQKFSAAIGSGQAWKDEIIDQQRHMRAVVFGLEYPRSPADLIRQSPDSLADPALGHSSRLLSRQAKSLQAYGTELCHFGGAGWSRSPAKCAESVASLLDTLVEKSVMAVSDSPISDLDDPFQAYWRLVLGDRELRLDETVKSNESEPSRKKLREFRRAILGASEERLARHALVAEREAATVRQGQALLQQSYAQLFSRSRFLVFIGLFLASISLILILVAIPDGRQATDNLDKFGLALFAFLLVQLYQPIDLDRIDISKPVVSFSRVSASFLDWVGQPAPVLSAGWGPSSTDARSYQIVEALSEADIDTLAARISKSITGSFPEVAGPLGTLQEDMEGARGLLDSLFKLQVGASRSGPSE